MRKEPAIIIGAIATFIVACIGAATQMGMIPPSVLVYLAPVLSVLGALATRQNVYSPASFEAKK